MQNLKIVLIQFKKQIAVFPVGNKELKELFLSNFGEAGFQLEIHHRGEY